MTDEMNDYITNVKLFFVILPSLLIFIFFGLRAILTKKIGTQIIGFSGFSLWIVSILSILYFTVLRFQEHPEKLELSLVLNITIIILFAFSPIILSGYQFYGTTQESFLKAFNHAIKKLNLTYEEKASSIFIPEYRAEVKLKLFKKSMLQTASPRCYSKLNDIVDEMNDYYARNPNEVKLKVYYWMVGVSVLGIIVCTYLFLR